MLYQRVMVGNNFNTSSHICNSLLPEACGYFGKSEVMQGKKKKKTCDLTVLIVRHSSAICGWLYHDWL